MDETVDKNKIYVGNLPFKTTEDDLLKTFDKFGVENVIILQDRDTNKSRGFGFITLYNAESVTMAIDECNGMTFEGRQIKVSKASKRGRGGGTYQNTSDRTGGFRSYSGYNAGGGGGGYGAPGQYSSGYSSGRGGYVGGGGYRSGGYNMGGYSSGGGYDSTGYSAAPAGYTAGDVYNSDAGYTFSSDGGWGTGASGGYYTGSSSGVGYGQGYGRGGRGGRGGGGWGGDQ